MWGAWHHLPPLGFPAPTSFILILSVSRKGREDFGVEQREADKMNSYHFSRPVASSDPPRELKSKEGIFGLKVSL